MADSANEGARAGSGGRSATAFDASDPAYTRRAGNTIAAAATAEPSLPVGSAVTAPRELRSGAVARPTAHPWGTEISATFPASSEAATDASTAARRVSVEAASSALTRPTPPRLASGCGVEKKTTQGSDAPGVVRMTQRTAGKPLELRKTTGRADGGTEACWRTPSPIIVASSCAAARSAPRSTDASASAKARRVAALCSVVNAGTSVATAACETTTST